MGKVIWANYTDEEILNMLKELSKKLGRVPKSSDLGSKNNIFGASYLGNRFNKTFAEILKMIGFEVKSKEWTKDEEEFLRKNYINMSDIEISKVLSRTESAIATKRVKMNLLKKEFRPPISKDEKQYIIKDYEDGLQINKIALKYKRDETTIMQSLKKWGIHEYRHNRWTNEEIELLKNIYGNKSWDYILKQFPNHTKSTILSKASELNISKEDYFWTEEDYEILKYGYKNNLSRKEIKKLLNNKFTCEAIGGKATLLNLVQNHWWENWELEYLKEHYSNTSLDEICEVLKNRKRKSIIQKAQILGLESAFMWKHKEDNFIKENYLKMTDIQMSKVLNRTWRAIKWRRTYLNLERPMRNTYGEGYVDENGIVFNSQDEGRVFNYIKSIDIFKYIKCLSTNHEKYGEYVFELEESDNYNKFYPDFVIEYISINNEKIKLNKQNIIEFYGMYNENKTNNPIIQKYVKKTKVKEKFYSARDDIYYIGIFNKDLTYNFRGLKKKLESFFMSNFNIDINNTNDNNNLKNVI